LGKERKRKKRRLQGVPGDLPRLRMAPFGRREDHKKNWTGVRLRWGGAKDSLREETSGGQEKGAAASRNFLPWAILRAVENWKKSRGRGEKGEGRKNNNCDQRGRSTKTNVA